MALIAAESSTRDRRRACSRSLELGRGSTGVLPPSTMLAMHGLGIAAHTRAHLFDRFRRLEEHDIRPS